MHEQKKDATALNTAGQRGGCVKQPRNDYRHEIKHEIGISDMIAIRQRMQAVAKMDVNVENGKYLIRSLYFDNLSDQALREKIDGVNRREKFRIRYYNGDTSQIHLEKKSNYNVLGTKDCVVLSV